MLLIPTLLAWTCFVIAVQAVGGQRYLTYGVSMGVMFLTLYFQLTGRMNWVGNWWIWGTLRWSDMSTFELDRQALLLNRLMMLGLAAFFTAVAVRAFGRRQADAIGRIHRLEPAPLRRHLLRLAPFALVPLVAGIALWLAVDAGFQGGAVEKKQRDYWKQNLATWKDVPQPAIADVDLDLADRARAPPARKPWHL